jgi:hypothetical protein
MDTYPPSAKLSAWGRPALLILHHALAIVPWLPTVGLWAMSWIATLHIGHWPQPWLDDPKFIVSGDPLYDLLYEAIGPLMLASCGSLLPFLLLTALVHRAYPRIWVAALVVLALLGVVIFWLDPGERMTWYLD